MSGSNANKSANNKGGKTPSSKPTATGGAMELYELCSANSGMSYSDTAADPFQPAMQDISDRFSV
ncbi:hypothetical protein CVT26_013989 [Gymnopilus dilepis]|uniref:Uncharacterized protein n=1 Tax=Gymnopilus dilepis TaxID=231916 RepID=A0A409VWA1_9AGAR|nr:hypothetical protein CVT26_013989 [Gymnopilus dilepis]